MCARQHFAAHRARDEFRFALALDRRSDRRPPRNPGLAAADVARVVAGFPASLLDETEAALLRTHTAAGGAALVVALGLL